MPLFVTSYTSLRGGLALDIRQNNNLSALTDLLGYILAALICSVLVRRTDKGLRLIEIGVDRQNRNLAQSVHFAIWFTARCDCNRFAHICVYNGLYHVQLTVEVGIAVCTAYINFYVAEILFRLLDACDNVAPVFGRGGLKHYAQLMGVAKRLPGIAGVIAGCTRCRACTRAELHQSC